MGFRSVGNFETSEWDLELGGPLSVFFCRVRGVSCWSSHKKGKGVIVVPSPSPGTGGCDPSRSDRVSPDFQGPI